MPIRTGGGTGIASIRLGDGTAIEEVRRGDGTVLWTSGPAIPDNGDLHARFDPRELSLSDGQAVSTWTDETGGGHDLTAGAEPTFIASGINGNPVVRFDGVDDFLDVAFSALAQPNTIFVVYQLTDTSGFPDVIYSSANSSDRNQMFLDNSGERAIYAGSTVDSAVVEDANAHISSALINGSNSVLRVDGTQQVSGDPGSQSLDGLTVGAEPGPSNFASVDVGEILIYPQDKSGIQSDVESYLDDGWGPIL